MISCLTGTVVSVSLDRAVISVGGMGFEVFATPTTLSGLRRGEEATVETELVVREDSLTLYGFADTDERDAFRVLLTVKGIGPRLALTTLAVLPPNALRKAVAGGDEAALQRIPGVGKKSAQRMLIEIGDKLGAPVGGSVEDSAAPVATVNPDVVSALVNLGWAEKQAEEAVRKVVSAEDGPRDVPSILRASLQELGGKRN